MINKVDDNNILQALNECKELQNQLAFYKKGEADLRILICEHLNKRKSVGSHKFSFDTWNVTSVKKVTTTLLADELEDIYDDLSEEERECIKFKPSLINAKYKAADTKLLDTCIITKPAMPSLKIELIPTIEEQI